MRFFTKHPFIKSLFSLSTRLWVGIFSASIALMAVLVAAYIGLGFSKEYYHVTGSDTSYNKILSLKVNGVIVGDSDEFFGGYMTTPGYAIKQQLYKAVEDDSIQAVILEINSPGGTIYGAGAIADGVAYYREHAKRPVYAHIQGLGASGAYWAAVSADKVIADRGSDVGSIGVIMGPFKYYDKVLSDDGQVLTQNGIESYNITAGRSKDVGDPYRRLTAEETETLQRSVNNDYDLFVNYVSERRGISAETIRDKLGAMTYDNKTALEQKMIDATAGREETYKSLAEASRLGDDYEVVRPVVLDDTAQYTTGGWIAGLLHRTPKQAAKSGMQHCNLDRVTLAYEGDVATLCEPE